MNNGFMYVCGSFLTDFKDSLYQNFIEDNRYMYLVSGLGTTLVITLLAVLIGIVLGFVVAIIRATYDKTGKLKILSKICPPN